VGVICASAHSFERPDPPGTLASIVAKASPGIVAKASPGVRFNEHEQFLLVLPCSFRHYTNPCGLLHRSGTHYEAMQDC
jgi:hypothetical protein